MNYNFKQLHPWFHEYDFNLDEFRDKYYANLIDIFKKKYNPPKKDNKDEGKVFHANVPLPVTEPPSQYLVPRFKQLIQDNYIVSDSWEEYHAPSVYLQDRENGVNRYHNHVSNSQIVLVTYLTLPKEGGWISFLDEVCEEWKFKPSLNKIYAFPGWLYHRPLPQEENTLRISINWGYVSSLVPINKMTGDRW